MHIVGSVLYGADDQVANYLAARIKAHSFGPPLVALGIIKNGILVGGVAFHEVRTFQALVAIALDKAGFIPWRSLFDYPFNVMKLARLTSIIDKRNKKSRELCERLGFKLEGVHPRGMDGGPAIALSYGMLRENCRWIRQ